jgi:hypothetical protein
MPAIDIRARKQKAGRSACPADRQLEARESISALPNRSDLKFAQRSRLSRQGDRMTKQ